MAGITERTIATLRCDERMEKQDIENYFENVLRLRDNVIIRLDQSRHVANLTFGSRIKAGLFVQQINALAGNNGMSAELYNSPIVEQAKASLADKTAAEIRAHRGKITYFEAELRHSREVQNRSHARSMSEYQQTSNVIKTLTDKIKELELQQQEFENYQQKLMDELELCKGTENSPTQIPIIRKKFGLETARFQAALPMYARKSDIIETVLKNQVSVVLGETGSGKSTQMLQYLSDTPLTQSGVVVCTQPRKLAATSLAERVAQEMACAVGQLVGYHVGRKKRLGTDTRLLYVTDHILLNDCLQDPLFTKYSCIVIDEAHERSIYTDLLLGFVKKAVASRPDLRVIITSATINPEIFVSYFKTSVSSKKVPVLQVSGRAYPVDVFYDEANSESDYVEAACKRAVDVHLKEAAGDILVFVVTPPEAERGCQLLEETIRKNPRIVAGNVIALELHGRQQMDDQRKVFEQTPPDKRKIVFATNCAETSITIPGIKYVIDTGKVKEASFDSGKNSTALVVQWTTKSSAEQRKGRAGRTACGKCFRLYTKDVYDEMRPESVPEILRIHLGQAMLKLLELGIKNPADFDFVESPPRSAITAAMDTLREIGACDASGITQLGLKLAKMSLEPRLAKLVILGTEEKLQLEAVITAAVCTIGDRIFFRSGTDEEKELADRRKLKFCDSRGDVITLVNVYRQWSSCAKADRGQWCFENSINGKSMKAVQEIVKDTYQVLQTELKMETVADPTESANWIERVLVMLLDCYRTYVCLYAGQTKLGYVPLKSPMERLSLHPSSSLWHIEEQPCWIVYTAVLTTNRTYAINVSVLQEEWVARVLALSKFEIRRLKEKHTAVKRSFSGVSGTCMQKLLARRAENLRLLEQTCLPEEVDLLNVSVKPTIDVDKRRGFLNIYTTGDVADYAKRKVEAFLRDHRTVLNQETQQRCLTPNGNVQMVLRAGGEISELLMPGETRIVRLETLPDSLTAYKALEILTKYGEIESCQDLLEGKTTNVCVTFRHYDSVCALLAGTATLPFKVALVGHINDVLKSSAIANFTVKIQLCRRPTKGFGFVEFSEIEDLCPVLRLTSLLVCDGPQSAMVMLSSNKSNNEQIYLRGVQFWMTEDLIKTAVCNALQRPKIGIKKVTLVRHKGRVDVRPEQESFRLFITDKLATVDLRENNDYILKVLPPQEHNCFLVAYINSNNPARVITIMDNLNGAMIGNESLSCKLDLKTSVPVFMQLYRLCSKKIDAEVEDIRAEYQDEVCISITQPKQQGGATSRKPVLVCLEAKTFQTLVDVRSRLESVINGRKLELSSADVLQMKLSETKRAMDAIEKLRDVIIRFDGRLKAIFIHGKHTDVQQAANEIAGVLRKNKNSSHEMKKIELARDTWPRGIMKALVVAYGPNLETLQEQCQLTTLELLIRHKSLLYAGNDAACGRLVKAVRDVAESVREKVKAVSGVGAVNDVSVPDIECAVCFDTVLEGDDECYITECCGHYYCKSCACGLLRNGTTNNQIPVTCAVDGCHAKFSLTDFRNLLSTEDQSALYSTCLRDLVNRNSQLYAFCVTPDCPTVYRRQVDENDNGKPFTCAECNKTQCTKCSIGYHYGYSTCAAYQASLRPDRTFEEWVQQNPSKRCLCPHCTMAIEKLEGCNHMTCSSCHIHFCWQCKETFKTSQECYGHMNAAHGTFV